jgi:NAD(P)-dependent dehydrogenase (short-subunit alcohol dehydrogenase family)
MNEQRDLEGLSALVTGATSGIGQEAARQLARHGAEVIVHGRDVTRGQAVVDAITADGGQARFAAADLRDPAELDDLARQADMVDVLVNNAGVSWFGPTPELDVATFGRLFAANVQAPYFLTAALAPKMAARGGGSIIMARPAQPDEIAHLIVFLASPKASYITGAVIAADGGRTAI